MTVRPFAKSFLIWKSPLVVRANEELAEVTGIQLMQERGGWIGTSPSEDCDIENQL